jgi:hypothetical protein
MKRKLEDFIRDNRSAFDDKVPNEKVWNNIEATLPKKSSTLWSSVGIWRAAAVTFMCLSAYLFISKRDIIQPIVQREELQEFRAVEEFYVQQIADKVELIDDYESREGFNGFTNDFHQLEAMYMVLKEEMKARPSSKVKDALVLNLLVRIDLLNQQLHKLEKGEYKEKEESNLRAS